MKGYVLAMYDIRAKQNYIYKAKKLKEIQGASAIIRDCFKDYLYTEAVSYRNEAGVYDGEKTAQAIYNYKSKGSEDDFNFEEFEKRMSGNQYIGEVVYDGGGNFFILYKSKEICKEVTYLFNRRLLKEAPGLNVLCTFIDVKDENNYNNSGRSGDYQKLYAKHRINENQESIVPAYGTLPIVQVDYLSSMPLTDLEYTGDGKERKKVSAESKAKYVKFYRDLKAQSDEEKKINEKILDNLVTEKGRESLLAIIYIDGNNMGAKVQRLLDGKTSYNDCVNELRKFSEFIQKSCVDDRKKEINGLLQKKLAKKLTNCSEEEKETEIRSRRLVLAAGDEITVICNARYAYDIAKNYLKAISEGTKDNTDYGQITSCAGIAIFHSHTPFSDAYRIAEECCENGKKKMKELQLQNACFLDYHYCQGAIGTSLEDIRKYEATHDANSLPWLIVNDESFEAVKNKESICKKSEIEDLQKELNLLGRSNVKGLAEKAGDGLAALELEIKRIIAHISGDISKFRILGGFTGKDDASDNSFDKEKYRKLIFDMVNVYDLWFTDDKSEVSIDE